MKCIFTIFFAAFLLLAVCELSEAKHEFHRHTKCTRLSMHRPLPINRPPYGLKPTNPPKRFRKPFVPHSIPKPMQGQKSNQQHTPSQVLHETQ